MGTLWGRSGKPLGRSETLWDALGTLWDALQRSGTMIFDVHFYISKLPINRPRGRYLTISYGHVYFVLMHETLYPELSGTRHFLENSADHHCIIILHHQDTVVIHTQAKSTENSKLHMPLFGEFGRSSRDLCHNGGYNAMNLGTIG